MQRIISMNPDHFAKQLLYHTTNNKLMQTERNRVVRINDLFVELNRFRKTADRETVSIQTS